MPWINWQSRFRVHALDWYFTLSQAFDVVRLPAVAFVAERLQVAPCRRMSAGINGFDVVYVGCFLVPAGFAEWMRL